MPKNFRHRNWREIRGERESMALLERKIERDRMKTLLFKNENESVCVIEKETNKPREGESIREKNGRAKGKKT